MNGKLKRAFCLMLSLVLLLQVAPVTQVKAQAVQVSLPEVQISAEILSNDLFYLASTSATLREGANETYLLRVGRGGSAETESSVLVKISDMTAEYGKDYTISVLDDSAKVVVPENNFALIDLIEGQPFTVSELKDDEEAEAILQEDEEAMTAARAGVTEAVNYLAERSGLDLAVEDAELDPVQQARNLYTGVEGNQQRVKASEDVFQEMQSIANVLTEVVPGAGVVLTFAPGETEKLLEITVNDNQESDGDRMFFMILSETEGATTNSAASTCAFTIADDEETTLSVVSFSADTYSEITDDMVTVTLHREGALNSVVTARVKTIGGTAEAGRDYSEVNREIVFPFGVSDMPLSIPVCTDWFDGEASFELTVEPGVGCTVENAEAAVLLTGNGTAASEADAALRSSGIEQTQTLLTVRTDPAINLSSPRNYGYESNAREDYSSFEIISNDSHHNQYNSSANKWEMDWVASSTGDYFPIDMGVIFRLTEDADPYWYGGARVKWGTTGTHNDHHARFTVAPFGYMEGTSFTHYNESYGKMFGLYQGEALFNAYQSNWAFGEKTVDFYPTKALSEKASTAGDNPRYEAIGNVAFLYRNYCNDCNWMWIYSVEPILRPFYAELIASKPMEFLQEDGSYASSDDDPAVSCAMNNTANSKTSVVFLGDSVTLSQATGTNISRYLYFSGIEYVPANNPETYVTVVTNPDLSDSTVTLDMTKDNIRRMFNVSGSVFAENTQLLATLKAGDNYNFYNDQFSTQMPTYGVMKIRPQFQYIDASITLQNPYSFPVCFTVSGTDYWVEAKQSRQIPNIHLGDVIAVTGVKIAPGFESDYVPAGVDVSYRVDKDVGAFVGPETRPFSDGGPVYIDNLDHRLKYQEVVISPNLIEQNTQIIVRVKTSELSKFDDTALTTLPSTVNGQYTEFTYVSAGQMVAGRIYPLTAKPKSENTVCVWTVNSGTKYIGDTLYFEAGKADSQEANTVTLSTVDAKTDLKLTGTLTYRDYNLRTHDYGTGSTEPAAGAVVVAGNMYAIANDDGTIESTSMKIPASPYRYSLRCLVMLNGNTVISDIKLTSSATKGTVDISSTFDNGVSPAASPIFRTMQVSVQEANNSGLIALGGLGETFHVSVSVKPVQYNVQRADGNGNYDTMSLYEKPVSVQLTVVDSTGKVRYTFDEIDECTLNTRTGTYTYSQEIPFSLADPDGTPLFDLAPGDKLLVKLTTDLLSQASGLELPENALELIGSTESMVDLAELDVREFAYTNMNTGFSIYTLNQYVEPIEQGLGNKPVKFEFTTLPLLGDVGMNLQLPFVNVGWQYLGDGYRMFIGVSPMMIIDKVKKTTTNRFLGDDGYDWANDYDPFSPISSWFNNLKKATGQVFNDYRDASVEDMGKLGAPQWRFNFALGMYFDFTVGSVEDEYFQADVFILSGMGGYITATVGFKTAWYIVLPVVFLPAYLGITIEVTGMGFLGAHREPTDPKPVSLEDAQTVPHVDLTGSFNDRFQYTINLAGMFQISAGVGLCGLVGVRIVGQCDVMFNQEPTTKPNTDDWGVNLAFKAGGMIDLYLGSVPLMYTFPILKFGKYKQIASEDNSTKRSLTNASFRFREGSDSASEWLGNHTAVRGAFTPRQTYPIVDNSYERADPQLITLRNGTVVLAYLSNEPDKGPYQRTTLMLTTCKNGVWAEPTVVSNDDTADFQPSIAETNDGRVLIAWVSTEADDITEDTPMADYLRQMEVYAAFAEIAEDGTVTVGETQRISHDRRAEEGQDAHYYDANPTVVCDTESGDAIIYYIKSGSVTEDAAELANPYTNDSIVCYLPYDSAKGKWMTDEFYDDEIGDPDAEQYLIDNFCGQRFVDAPTFEGENGWEYYSIPDFTAIASDGLVYYAYTIDRDSSNDTDTDKELILQVYSFESHYTYYLIRLTDDVVADALPQFIRAERTVEGETTASTKLFWYRSGLGVCWLDVSDLIANGINADGTVKPAADGSDTRTTPIYVDSIRENENQAKQMADFRVVEDANGSIYVIWTASVEDEDSIPAQEVFAVCQYVDPDPEIGSNGAWSRPYQLTQSGKQNDEVVLTLVGEDLLLVHNQYQMELTDDENEPLALTELQLVATTLEPCGSVKTQNATMLHIEENAPEAEVTLPQPGETVTVRLEVANDGLTTAEGYHADVWQVVGTQEEKVWTYDTEDRLVPNSSETLEFEWTVPETVAGTYLRIETQENHYTDRDVLTTEPLQAQASYTMTDVRTAHGEDGFHLLGTLTNVGNAETAADETLTVYLTGPYDQDLNFDEDERMLYEAPIEALAVGESRSFDVVVDVPAEMLETYRYASASVEVARAVESTGFNDKPITEYEALSNAEHVEFRITRPVEFRICEGEPIALNVAEEKQLTASLELGTLLGGDEVLFTVGDVNIARLEDGNLVGVAAGETTLYATHIATGASVSVPVTVTGSQPVDPPMDNPFTDVEEGKFYYNPVLWAYYHDPQITAGTSETTFSPKDGATRAQVVTFLWRAAGSPEPTETTSRFTDVPDGQYYTKAVLWAAENGITSGTSETTFTPKRICTRAETVTFLYRFAGSPEVGEVENPFTDVPDGKYFTKPVLWAVEQKVTAGTSKTTFSPNDDCTRGQVVTFLYRYMGEE